MIDNRKLEELSWAELEQTGELEENLALLHQTSGILGSDLAADEVRYLVESAQLAEESIWRACEYDTVDSLMIR